MILNGVRLRREVAARGVTLSAFARAASVSPNTITRAANGGELSERSLRTIVRTLIAMPPLPGALELLDVNGETTSAAQGHWIPERRVEGSGDAHQQSD
jgi:transcriptional regulator with XRE-family HTH domain